MDELTALLLTNHKIKFDRDELSFQIKTHPSYPSLHSITAVLDHFNIDNIALRVPNNQKIFSQLPQFFLAQTSEGKMKNFVLVEKIKNHIKLINEDATYKKIATPKFLEVFTGNVVIVEKSGDETVNNTSVFSRKLNSFLLIFIAIITIGFIVNLDDKGIYIPYLLLSLAGLYVSIAIYHKEQGNTTLLGDAVCSGKHPKKDCNSVLTSNGSKIGGFKLIDISAIYFGSLSIASFLFSLSQTDFGLLFYLSLLPIPMVLYSIYYQYRIVRAWCFLCLIIVTILSLQAILTILWRRMVFDTIILDYSGMLFIVLSVSTTYLIWNGFDKYSKGVKNLRDLKVEYFKFKKDITVFKSLLGSSKSFEFPIKNEMGIMFGNADASIHLVIITNPFCNHCKSLHTTIETIIEQYGGQIKVVICFNVNDNDELAAKVASRITQLYQTKNQKECLEAMGDIYGSMDYESWFDKWQMDDYNNKNIVAILRAQRQWCLENEISFTPAIYLNGKEYPKHFKRDELPYFIGELCDE